MASPTSQEMIILNDININRYFLVATLALLAYDYVLTFDDEKRLIWPSRLSLVKVVFFLNRYLPFIGSVGQIYVIIYANPSSAEMCKPIFQTFCGFVLTNYLIAEFILYLRAYAVWGGDRQILVILVLGYLGFFISGAYLTLRTILHISVLDIRRTLLPSGCILVFDGHIEWPAYLGIIISEIFALTMLLVKAFRMGYSARMKQIVADGVVYFILMLVTSTCNMFVLRLTPPALANVLTVTQAIIHSIICSRLILGIRGAYQHIPNVASLSSNGNFHMTPLHAVAAPSVLPYNGGR